MIRREQVRLERIFSLLLLACSTTQSTNEAGVDATIALDAMQETLVDASDEDVQRCKIGVTPFDTGNPDGDLGCEYFFNCGVPEGAAIVGCDLYTPDPDMRPLNCRIVEGKGCADGSYVLDPDAGATVICRDCLGGAGRGSSHVRKIALGDPSLGARFAWMAHAEAASVHAFARLERELAHHRAPRALLRAARRSMRDEARHARAMETLARSFGAKTPHVRVREIAGVRSLEAIAIENAREGCVRETIGALEAHVLARRAPPEMRSTFARIAKDETRHAALAWAIARWSLPKISERARQRVEEILTGSGSRCRRSVPS